MNFSEQPEHLSEQLKFSEQPEPPYHHFKRYNFYSVNQIQWNFTYIGSLMKGVIVRDLVRMY